MSPDRGLSIRPLARADAEVLAPLLATMDPWARLGLPPASLLSFLGGEARPGVSRWCLESDGAVAGAIVLIEAWLLGPYVQHLSVLPAYQGSGLGSAAMAWIEARARQRGDRNLWVCASSFNGRALAFYAHHGFVRVGVLEGLLRQGLDEILLRKPLAVAPEAPPRSA